jgi:hypothetical protein
MDHLKFEKQQLRSEAIPSDLLLAAELAYAPCGLTAKNFVKEKESEEYAAYSFELNHRQIKYRAGKITPTKIGQFVTFWKRIGDSVILPYDAEDPFDFFVVSVRSGDRLGQFVFPKAVLLEKGVLSKQGKGGKRAMRIYPSWDLAENRQAKITQAWQLNYFFEILSNQALDIVNIQKLFF